MDVVTDSGSVMGIIIVPEDTQTFQLADRNLGNIGNQVVRNPLRVLSDPSGLMGPDRIEVTEQHDIPLRIPYVQVCQDLFQHPLRLSVRIGDLSLRAFLRDRDLRRVSVYGRGRTEDHIFAAMISHHIAQDQCSADIIMIIFPWLGHRFSDCFEPCEIDHSLNLLVIKNLLQVFPAQYITFIEFQ